MCVNDRGYEKALEKNFSEFLNLKFLNLRIW